jgi:hypothetical protein
MRTLLLKRTYAVYTLTVALTPLLLQAFIVSNLVPRPAYYDAPCTRYTQQREPLAVSLSKDGITFDRAFAVVNTTQPKRCAAPSLLLYIDRLAFSNHTCMMSDASLPPCPAVVVTWIHLSREFPCMSAYKPTTRMLLDPCLTSSTLL